MRPSRQAAEMSTETAGCGANVHCGRRKELLSKRSCKLHNALMSQLKSQKNRTVISRFALTGAPRGSGNVNAVQDGQCILWNRLRVVRDRGPQPNELDCPALL